MVVTAKATENAPKSDKVYPPLPSPILLFSNIGGKSTRWFSVTRIIPVMYLAILCHKHKTKILIPDFVICYSKCS
jgi:hypothetical protein